MLSWPPIIKLFLLLLYDCNFSIVINSNVIICYAGYLICSPVKVLFDPKGCYLQVVKHCSRDLICLCVNNTDIHLKIIKESFAMRRYIYTLTYMYKRNNKIKGKKLYMDTAGMKDSFLSFGYSVLFRIFIWWV